MPPHTPAIILSFLVRTNCVFMVTSLYLHPERCTFASARRLPARFDDDAPKRLRPALVQSAAVRGQGSGARGQGPGARGQGPGVRGQGSGARGQNYVTLSPCHRAFEPTPRGGRAMKESL